MSGQTGSGRRPARRGELVDLRVEDLGFGGLGVARVEGLAVMVSGGLPGDRVRARIRRRRSRYAEAQVVEILAPSPARRVPPCRHAGVCGGCSLMALPEAEQTSAKERQAVELLRRIGGLAPREILPAVPPPRSFFYRNKMEFTFGVRPWEETPPAEPSVRRPALGLHPRGRFDRVFDAVECRLQSPLTNRILACLREEAGRLGLPAYDSRTDSGLLRHVIVRTSRAWPDLLAVIVARERDERIADLARGLRRAVPQMSGCTLLVHRGRATVARGEEEIVLWGRPYVRETIGGWTWRIGSSSFFQTSAEGAELLLERVLAWGRPGPREIGVDLYCGAGMFTLPLARRMAQVAGIESEPEAVAEGRRVAREAGVGNADFRAGLVEDLLDAGRGRSSLERLGIERAPDLVVLDPPRAGLHPRALRGLADLGARRIVYVSCNPATLARDAGALAGGGYEAARFQVLDLFPQTPHMEAVMLLERGEG